MAPIPNTIAPTVTDVFPDLGIGGGTATGWQETSELQVSVPALLTTTQARLRHSR